MEDFLDAAFIRMIEPIAPKEHRLNRWWCEFLVRNLYGRG